MIDQISSNLTLSVEAERLSHSMDDDPLINSSLDESRGEPPSINVFLKLTTNYIQLSNETQEWPVCLSIVCSHQAIEERAGMDLICLIENSSYAAEKSETIKSSIEFITSRLTGQDRLSIVSFNDSAKRLSPLTSMSYTGKIKIAMALRNLTFGGSCDLAEGIIFALSVLNNRRNTNYNTNVIVLSTGKDNHSNSINERVSEIFREFSPRIQGKFSINSISLWKPTSILSYIAEETNGNCYFPSSDLEYFEALAYCCGVMESKIAEDLCISLVPVDSPLTLLVSKIYSENSEMNFRMPDILAGTTTDTAFILRFLPSFEFNSKALELVRGKVEFTVRGNRIIEQISLKVPVFSTDKVCREIEIDEDVLVCFYRVKTADIMNEAVEICAYDIACARDLIDKGLIELEECCVSKHGFIKELCKELGVIRGKLSHSEEIRNFVRNRARNHWSKRCFDLAEYQNPATNASKSRLKALIKLS